MRRLAACALTAIATLACSSAAQASAPMACGAQVRALTSAWEGFTGCPPERIAGTINGNSRAGASWSGTVAFTLREKDPVTGFADSEPIYELTEAQISWQYAGASGECSYSGSGTLALKQLRGQIALTQRAFPSGTPGTPAEKPYTWYTGSISLNHEATLPKYTVTCPPPPDGSGTRQESITSIDSLDTAVYYDSLERNQPTANVLTDLKTFAGTITQGNTFVATWTWSFTGGVKNATKISARGVRLIKREEGFRGRAYNDELGYCTIGYGTVFRPLRNCTKADRSKKMTEAQADARLRSDLNATFEPLVRNLKPDLTQCQYDALVSFAYNVSSKSWGQLTKNLTTAKLAGLSKRLLGFNKGKDTKTGTFRVVKAVDARRHREAALFDRCPCDGALPALKPPYFPKR